MRIGIDIGKVIIGGDGPEDTSFFSNYYLETKPVQDSFYGIQRIVLKVGPNNVWLISKCGKSVQEKTLNWLEHHNFYEETGILKDHIKFCKERSDKAPIAKKLKLTHFIDDRWDVLKYMNGLVPNLWLFGPQKRKSWNYIPFPEFGSNIGYRHSWVHQPTWNHIIKYLED